MIKLIHDDCGPNRQISKRDCSSRPGKYVGNIYCHKESFNPSSDIQLEAKRWGMNAFPALVCFDGGAEKAKHQMF